MLNRIGFRGMAMMIFEENLRQRETVAGSWTSPRDVNFWKLYCQRFYAKISKNCDFH